MKQTAVEWFYNEMEKLRVKAEITNMDGNDFIIAKVKLLNQAKAKETIKFTKAELNHLANLIADNERDGTYYGNRKQYWKRSFELKQKLLINYF